MKKEDDGLYILLISVHGLIRGEHLELGCDADTGGQTKYVVELARALAEQSNVKKVDLVTRLINDTEKEISTDYSKKFEKLNKKSQIVRIECADQLYLPKENLWDYLDSFSDNQIGRAHV